MQQNLDLTSAAGRYDRIHGKVDEALSDVQDVFEDRRPKGPTEPEILETRDGMSAGQPDDAQHAQQQAEQLPAEGQEQREQVCFCHGQWA